MMGAVFACTPICKTRAGFLSRYCRKSERCSLRQFLQIQQVTTSSRPLCGSLPLHHKPGDVCLTLRCNRDVKRPANEELPSPALKKVKLADDGDSMGVNSEEISVIVPPSESATDMETTGKSSPEVKGKGKGKKTKQASTETGGTFKEQPFTFIPADEPSLQACMCVALTFVRDEVS